MSEFLKHKKAGKIRPNTYRFYESLTRLYINPMIGHYTIKEVVDNPKIIQDFINALTEKDNLKEKPKEGEKPKKISPTTIERIRATLRAAFTFAVIWGWANKNVAGNRIIELPEVPEFEVTPYTEEQVVTLITHLLESDILLPAIIAPTTGLRRGEVCALKRTDIDFEHYITFPKFTLTRVNGVLTRTPTKTKGPKQELPFLKALLK